MYGIGYASVSAVNDKFDDDDDDDDDAHSTQRLAENESMSDPHKRRDQCKYLTCVYICLNLFVLYVCLYVIKVQVCIKQLYMHICVWM